MLLSRMSVLVLLCCVCLQAVADDRNASQTRLDRMKNEFADLMRARAGLTERARASTRTIAAARRTSPRSGNSNTATAQAYRSALMRVERAVDEHPRVKALQADYDALQEQKLEISHERAAILDAWHAERQQRAAERTAAVAEVSRRTAQERAALLKNAGVKDLKDLSDADRQAYRQVHMRLTNELARIKEVYPTKRGDEAERKDAAALQFKQTNEQTQEIEQQQANLKDAMRRLRQSLRRNDAAIAALQQAAREASQAHVVAIDSRPEVAEAQKFISTVNTKRAEIDKQARVLRRAILAADPDYRSELDRQALAGGVAMVGEDFWAL